MRITKRKLSELSVGNNVIIPIPQYDRGPTDSRNILGLIEEVSEYGYRVGTSVGTLSVNHNNVNYTRYFFFALAF
jgi:hypothetical protein